MNVIQVELVNSQGITFLNAITVSIIIAFGLILFVIGNSSKKPSFTFVKEILSLFKDKTFLNGMGLTFMIFGFALLVLESSQVRDSLVALAVIFATVFSVISLKESEKLRKENSNLREKENLEKGLDQINTWLIQVIEHISILSRHVDSAVELKRKIMECRADLTNDVAASINTLAILNEIVKNPQVSDTNKENFKNAIHSVDKSIRDHVTILFDIDLDNITEESTQKVADSVSNLTTRIKELLQMTSHILYN